VGGSTFATIKLLRLVLGAPGQQLQEMLPRLRQRPYFHVVVLCTDGEVATGADGKLAAATVSITSLGGQKPKPNLGAMFGKLLDILQPASECECLHCVSIYEQHTLCTVHQHGKCQLNIQTTTVVNDQGPS